MTNSPAPNLPRSELPMIREVIAANGPSPRFQWGPRIGAAAIGAVCLTLLVLSARLSPDSAGHGTHTQLGLPPCGWAAYFGKPCATCGMTTAWAYAARGRFDRSFVTQPMGMVLCLAAAAVFWGAMHTAFTGSRLGWVVGRLARPAVLWGIGGLMLAAWAYKWVTWNG
jgi:hypothetical protein